jgi:two-component system sensor histidine kinase RegB
LRSPDKIQSFSLIASAPLGSATWLLYLRSFAVAGQLLTILAVRLLTNIDLPFVPLLLLVALTAVTNAFYGLWLNRQQTGAADIDDLDVSFSIDELNPHGQTPLQHSVSLGLMILDLLTLTAMLYFSGGAGNPFSFFYFVNLAVGGVMIRRRAAWSLTVAAVGGYAFLMQRYVPVEGLTIHNPPGIDVQSVAKMFAFATAASVVTYFVTRTAGTLRYRERQLLRTQAEQAASQRLEGLTTLAAGAAHELATPLSTIDVIVRELSRHLEDVDKPESVDDDLTLIDEQLEMCRQILQRMRAAAGDSMAQQWDQTTVGELIDCALEGIRHPERVDVIDSSDDIENHELWVPQEAVAQAVRNLIHNGLDASPKEGRVRLESNIHSGNLQLAVIDSGQGMTLEVLNRASDPFFTTKEPGRGIGLGLFLTRNVISRLGGELDFQSTPGFGTVAVATIPLGTSRPPSASAIYDRALRQNPVRG